MAKRARTERARPARAWLLIDFRGPTARSVQRLKRVEVARGWPGGASVMRVDKVKRIKRNAESSHGKNEKRTHEFNAVAEIHAKNRAALDGVLDYIEKNFSHVEAYEF
jgi:GTPase Era involved in 16S rRNA processing